MNKNRIWTVLVAAIFGAMIVAFWPRAVVDATGYVPIATTADLLSIETLCVKPRRDKMLKEQEISGANGAASATKNQVIDTALAAKLRTVRYEICDEWIRHHFLGGRISDQLIALRDSIDRQKDNARNNVRGVFTRLQIVQWIIVMLGLLATIFSAWASRSHSEQSIVKYWVLIPRNTAFVAMILTATITAATALGDFYNLRGGVTRNWTVESGMTSLNTQIDDELQTIAASEMPVVTQERIKQWTDTRNQILQQAGEEWTRVVRGDPAKKQ